jgi:hypothetical protein
MSSDPFASEALQQLTAEEVAFYSRLFVGLDKSGTGVVLPGVVVPFLTSSLLPQNQLSKV